MRKNIIYRLAFPLVCICCIDSGAMRADVLFEEDFETVELHPVVTFPSEIAERAAWSSLATAQANGKLTGWTDEKLGVLATIDPINDGVREFYGWTFVDKEWWIATAGDQERSQWTRGYGNVGVADNDEFDDYSFGPNENLGPTGDACDHVGTASPGSGGCYAATLTTPAIDIAGEAAGSVRFVFDSSWRPEGDGVREDDPATPVDETSSGTFQTGRLEVSFDGGAFQEIFTYRSDNSEGQRTLVTTPADPVGVFKADLELVDEVVDVSVNNPAGASTMQIRFNTYDAGNDWWWSVDNLQAYTGAAGPRDPVLKIVLDRDSGNVSLVNETSKAVSLRGFEISSADGAFDVDAANLRSEVDSNWVQLSLPGTGTDISEGHVASELLPSGSAIDLGPAWLPYFADKDDISIQYLVDGQVEPIDGIVEVVGGDPFPFLDLNFDRQVDILDWSEFLAVTEAADLSHLTEAQSYRKGDLDADGRLGVNDVVVFQREFDLLHGAGAFEAALADAVPEPTSAASVALAAGLLVTFGRRRREVFRFIPPRFSRSLFMAAACVVVLSLGNASEAAVTVDRFYQFGDDPRENAVAGEEVISNVPDSPFATGDSLDSAGALGGQLVVNVSPTFAGPNYVQINDRPDGQSGLGVEFDGANFENLIGVRFGTPQSSISSTSQLGAVDYSGILDRGMQFWTKPLATPTSGNEADDVHIVMDTNNHGALINADGRFTMRYNREDFVGDGPAAIASTGEWYHVMVVRPDGPSNGARMYVNGIAVAATTGDYLRGIPAGGGPSDIPDSAALVIGGATFPESNQFSQGFANNYTGIVDDLEIFAVGFNGGPDGIVAPGDFGVFDPATDNDYIAAFAPAEPLDLDGDSNVDLDDVAIFAGNWRTTKELNGVQVGDLETLALGDFNLDGTINIRDWERLNAASPALAAAAMGMIRAAAVPEPAGWTLAAWAIYGWCGRRRVRSGAGC